VRHARPRSPRCTRDENGFVAIGYVMIWTIALVVLVLVLEVIVNTYARAAVGHALDSGVRAGARVDASSSECQRRAQETINTLLGGSMRNGVAITCDATPARVQAVASVRFEPWLPISPRWKFTLTASATKRTP
jgi:Flp pilus assembly protein TadG